jgi:hypothetical protein
MPVQINDFVIDEISVMCPQCSMPFATPQVMRTPAITRETTMEADLHRVLPHAAIRAAIVAICPACIYTWWTTSFEPHYYVPDLLVPSPEIEYPKKFAHAVLTGRNAGAHALDRALLALNGCWCARETYIDAGPDQVDNYRADNERWMTLVAQELEEALRDESWKGNRSRYTFIFAEIKRQLGDFETALRAFDAVDIRRSMLPSDLVRHQRSLASTGNADPTELPPYLVEAIFMPKPVQIIPDEPAIEEQTVLPLTQPQTQSIA